MRDLTPGLEMLRDALGRLLAHGDGWAGWADIPEEIRTRWIEEAEELLADPDPFGLLAAVDTLVGEGFQRGASPAVGALLAEMQLGVGDTAFGAGFQDGLARAIQVLAGEDAAKQQEAYQRGFRDGHAAQRPGAKRPNWTPPDG